MPNEFYVNLQDAYETFGLPRPPSERNIRHYDPSHEEWKAKVNFSGILYRTDCLTGAGDLAFMAVSPVLHFWFHDHALVFFKYLGIEQSKTNKLLVKHYPTLKARQDNRPVETKLGKILRKFFPSLSDHAIEHTMDVYKDTLCFDVSSMTLHSSSDRYAFRDVYTMPQLKESNLSTTCTRKSLKSSCMRHEFGCQSHHPCEAYGSGEFTIYWLESPEKNLLGARSVVHTPSGVMGPVYGANEGCISRLTEFLQEEKGYISFEDASNPWDGAKFLSLPNTSGSGGWCAPYMDVGSEGFYEDDGHLYLTFDRSSATITSGGHEGLQHSHRACCHSCGVDVDEDDTYETPQGTLCDSCYHEEYTTCERTGEAILRDESIYVYVEGYRGGQYCEVWSSSYEEETVRHQGNLYSYSLADRDGHGNSFLFRDDTHFYCGTTEKHWPVEDMVMLDGEPVHESVPDVDQHSFNPATGEWETLNAA